VYRYSLVNRDKAGLRVHRLVQVGGPQPPHPAEARRLGDASGPPPGRGIPHRPVRAGDLAALRRVATARAGHSQPRHKPTRHWDLLNRATEYLTRRAELRAAQAAATRALTILEAAHGPDHPQVAATLSNLGNVLTDLGELEAARAAQERALAIEEVNSTNS
jgi:hypothetical protein